MADKPRQKALLAVFVIFRDAKNRILLIRRHNTGWRDGEYTLPAGTCRPGRIGRCSGDSRSQRGIQSDSQTERLSF